MSVELQRLLDIRIEAGPLGIIEPSPFVEIPDDIHGMDPEELRDFLRGGPVGMDKRDAGPVEGQVITVNPACQVNILGIKEETFVEETDLAERVESQEHEASGMIGDVPWPVEVEMLQQIAVAFLLEPVLREDDPGDHVKGCRETAAV